MVLKLKLVTRRNNTLSNIKAHYSKLAIKLHRRETTVIQVLLEELSTQLIPMVRNTT